MRSIQPTVARLRRQEMKMANCLYHKNKAAHSWSGHIHLYPKYGGLTKDITAGFCSQKCLDWDLTDSGSLGDCQGCYGYRESVEIKL